MLYYRRLGTLLFGSATMTLTGGSQYQATIPGSEMTEAGIEYYIRAVDNFGVASVHGIHFITPEDEICTTPFTDDFSDGNANGWRPKTPSLWHVNPINGNNAYCLDVLDLAGSEYTVMETCSWDNFELTLRGRSTAADNRNFFILFGTPDPDDATFNGYYLQFAIGGVRLFRTIDGAGVVIASHPQDFASDNNFHQITVRREGANLKAFGDGLLLIDLNDTVFPSGVIGFGSFKSTACFDDVNISFGDCPGGDTFSDDFNDGNANGWTPLTSSRWQVRNDAGSLRYYLNTSDYNSPDEKRLGELSIINSQTWGDFTFECDAKSEDAGIGNSGADLSIVFGYQDFDSYYYVNYNRESGFTEMHRIHDGGPRVTLATYNAPTFDDGNYHKLRIEREGSVMRAYFDGILILSGNDSFFGEGRIGVGSFNDAGYFDNIVITGCKTSGLPNLLGTALLFSQTTYKPGDAITFSGTVMNNGSSPTRPDFRINVFLTDSPTEPDYNLLVHSFTMPALDAGNSNSFTQIGTIPPTTPADTYYLWMNIDVDDQNLESNEDDNSFRTNTQLTVGPPPPVGVIKPIVSNPQTSCSEYFVDIRVENVTNLFGASFVLNYTNTAYVNYLSSENGGFLGNDVLLYANPEDALGKVSIGVTRKTGQPGSTGSGVIVRVKFSSPASTPVGTPVTFSITDIVGIDPLNNSITLTPQSASTVLNCGTVWPGDTNNDGIVNQADVLPLGLHWNRTGPARSGGSCAWSAQFASSWTPLAATYADANGDGIVNQADVLCIGLNWGRTHTAASSAPLVLADNTLAKVAFAEVFAEVVPAQLTPGQEFILKIQAAEARNLFGLAFELQNDPPELLQILSAEPEALFGHEALLYSHLEESGNNGIGITRKNGQPGTQGAGAVIRLRGKISNEARLGDVITLTLNDVVAQNHEGHVGALSSSSLQVVVGAGANLALLRNSRTVTEYQLYQNYPNPFNPETMIAYDILEAGHVTLQIFNTVGQEVRTLIDETQSPGAYQVRWDGRNTFGQTLPSGIYFYRLQAGEFVQIRKMTLVQ
ncbi:T9SS type A sorting domain-containing protein [candidate division KSB1 bacterium]|nr:T9SS type A sorting domain-containing protein [candidate division KSB1 bacterium]